MVNFLKFYSGTVSVNLLKTSHGYVLTVSFNRQIASNYKRNMPLPPLSHPATLLANHHPPPPPPSYSHFLFQTSYHHSIIILYCTLDTEVVVKDHLNTDENHSKLPPTPIDQHNK